MSISLECIGCRSIKEFPEYEKYPVCEDCNAWEEERHEKFQQEASEYNTCSLCGYVGPAIDSHHIHGRKVSNQTIRVCANCHREIHAGVRLI
jgi:predicted RNA-binding Zn-ribbon protein involved in translation (DUF1610 family)